VRQPQPPASSWSAGLVPDDDASVSGAVVPPSLADAVADAVADALASDAAVAEALASVGSGTSPDDDESPTSPVEPEAPVSSTPPLVLAPAGPITMSAH
jgi:hypothetical protein